MIVTLDGQKLDHTFDPAASLQDVIAQARAAVAAERLIISVALDGRPASTEILNQALAAPAAYGQVDLQSADRTQIAHEVFSGLAAEFAVFDERFNSLADEVSGGDVASAMNDVGRFVELWQNCYRALTECSALLGRDLTAHEHGGRTVKTALDELVEKLKLVREALEAHDMVLLADLLRYELPPVAQQWTRLLDALAGAAPQPA